MALIGNLITRLGLESSSFSSGLAKARKQAAADSGAIAASLGKITAAAGLLGITLSAGIFVGMAKSALAAAAALGENAKQVGVTVEQYQVLERLAMANGTSMEAFSTGLQKLNKNLGDAQRGSKEAIAAFAAFGITPQQIASYRQGGDAIRAVMEGTKKLGDSSLQTSALTRLMGKSAADLIPTLEQGAAGYDAVTAAAMKSGLITQEQADKADAANDAIDLLAKTLETKLAIALLDNLPAINSVIDGLSNLIDMAAKAIGWLNKLQGLKDIEAKAETQMQLGRQVAEIRFHKMTGAIPSNIANALEAAAVGAARGNIASIDQAAAARNAPVNPSRVARPGARGGATTSLAGGHAKKGKSADQLAAQAERQEKEALRAQYELDREELDGKRELLRAQQDLGGSTEDRANMALQLLDLDHEARAKEIDFHLAMDQSDRTLSAEQKKAAAAAAAASRIRNDQVTALGKQKVLLDEEIKRQEEEAELEQQGVDIRRDALQAQADLADTAAQRREIELRILALNQQEEREALQRTVDQVSARIGTSNEQEGDWMAREKALRTLASLPEKFEAAKASAMRGTQGPLESFLTSLPTTAAKANEALQNIAVDGLQSLSDGIVDAIMHAHSLGDAFSAVAKQIIADLIKIAVERAIIAPLLNAIGGGFGGGIGKSSSSFGSGMPKGFAGGGFTGWSSPRAVAGVTHGQEFVFDAAAVRRLGLPNLEALRRGGMPTAAGGDRSRGGVVINQHFAPNFAGNAATREDLALMARITRAETVNTIRDLRARGAL